MMAKLAKGKAVMEKEGKMAKRKMAKKLGQSVIGKMRAPLPPPSRPPPAPTDPASWTRDWQKRAERDKELELLNNCESE